jgi:TRAP-type mannitol/chloroaromatic compound transport system permease small subunit
MATLRALDTVLALCDRLCLLIALISGGMFLLLAFYITADALGRSFGGLYSGAAGDIAVYTLAVGSTWGFAHALRVSAHVRVDLLLPLIPARWRYLLNVGNVILIGIFASMTSWYCWKLVHSSWLTGTRSITPLQTPLVIPQALMAAGITILAIEALLMAAYGLARYTLLDREQVIRDPDDPMTASSGGGM